MAFSQLAAVLHPWARICETATEVDQISKDLEEKQAQGKAARSKLVEDTKAFEKLEDKGRLDNTPGLLRSYQAEVQALSKRCKWAETCLLEVLKSVKEAPTPSEVQLDLTNEAASVSELREKLRQSEEQVLNLAEGNRDLDAELQTMKNQDVTVRKLKKRIEELEAGKSEGQHEVKRQKDEEWRKKNEQLSQELSLAREQLSRAQEQLAQQREFHESELQRLHQERLEEQRRSEELALARSLELDSLSGDLEKAQAELERERLQRTEMQATSEPHGSVRVLQSLLDGAQQRALGLERELMDAERRAAEVEARAEGREGEVRLERERLADLAAAKDSEISNLREQLSLRPSFDEVAELRQRLRNVEAVENSDEAAAATDLERRLLQRQKELDGQVKEAQLRATELAAERDSLVQQLRSAEEGLADLRRLVSRLEDEIAGAAAGGCMAVKAVDSGKDGGAASLEALIPSEDPAAVRQAMPSMLDIITGQRDRLRERLGELEQERDRWRTSAEEERKRAEMMHRDNVQLLERSRYLQSLQPGPGGKAKGRDRDVENRYSSAYEESLSNPWQQFRDFEKARRVASLGAGERILVELGSLLLSSKIVRVFVLGYVFAMHFLVFAVLLRLAQMHHSC